MALTVPISEIVEKANNPLLVKHETWERVLLGDIAAVQNGFAFQSSLYKAKEGFPLIRIRDVGEDASETFYAGEFDSVFVVEPGDLLVGMDGDFKCARWRGPRGLLNQRVCRIILKTDKYHPKFLDYALPGYLKAINDVTSSVTVKHLSSNSIKEIPLPLPPFEAQTRIVAEIEKQFSRLDEAVANLKRVKTNLKRYKGAVLKAAVEGQLTEEWRKQHPDVEPADKLLERILAERRKAAGKGKYKEPLATDTRGLPDLPAGWVWATPDVLAKNEDNAICAGPFGTIFKAKDFRDEGVPIIFLRHVSTGKYLTHKPGFMDRNKWAELFKPYSVYGGELLVTKLGEPPGVCAIYPEGIGPAMVTPDVMKLSVDCAGAHPMYLMHFFNSETARKNASDLAFGTTRLRLTLPIFRKLAVPLPPLAEQHQIVAEVERRLSIVAGAESQVDANLRRTDRLRQSILKQAFSGQLVPQDPNDEPASVLLERIRATPPAQTKAPVARQRKHRTPTTKTGAPSPEPLPMVAEAQATYGDAIIARILAVMQPGRDYARADLVDSLGLTTGQWTVAIQELKRRGKVRQTGEKRGARYQIM